MQARSAAKPREPTLDSYGMSPVACMHTNRHSKDDADSRSRDGHNTPDTHTHTPRGSSRCPPQEDKVGHLVTSSARLEAPGVPPSIHDRNREVDDILGTSDASLRQQPHLPTTSQRGRRGARPLVGERYHESRCVGGGSGSYGQEQLDLDHYQHVVGRERCPSSTSHSASRGPRQP